MLITPLTTARVRSTTLAWNDCWSRDGTTLGAPRSMLRHDWTVCVRAGLSERAARPPRGESGGPRRRAVPLRWARRGWPGAPGSGCSCRCGGSWAGRPGRSSTWSSSPCQWGRAPRWRPGWRWGSCSSAGLADRRSTGGCRQKPSLLRSGCVAGSTQTPREKIKPAKVRGTSEWEAASPARLFLELGILIAFPMWTHIVGSGNHLITASAITCRRAVTQLQTQPFVCVRRTDEFHLNASWCAIHSCVSHTRTLTLWSTRLRV